MSDDLIIHPKNEMAVQGMAPSVTQTVSQNAPNSTNVGYADKLIVQPTYIFNAPAGQQTVILNPENYNLFVVKNADFGSGVFSIPKNRCVLLHDTRPH